MEKIKALNKKDPKKLEKRSFWFLIIKTLNILSFFARYWLLWVF